jgi:hypothetical protein
LFDQVWHLPMFDAIALMKNIWVDFKNRGGEETLLE